MVTKITLIGDIHGVWNKLHEILRNNWNPCIQIGDLGLGFPRRFKYLDLNDGVLKVREAPPDPKSFPGNFRFIRGNHDNPEVCRNFPNYLGDYGVDKDTGIFFVSGGYSIDIDNRIPGVDWWAEEELSYSQFNECIDLYEKVKPSIVISHECPTSILNIITKNKSYGPSRTAMALQMMLEIWQPKEWYFGHHHEVWTGNSKKTKFTCIAINQCVDISI